MASRPSRVGAYVSALCVLGGVAVSAATGASSAAGPLVRGSASTNVTVYTSLPLDSIDRPQTSDVVRGEELALAQVNNTVGPCNITFQQLDDSTAQAGRWDPGRTSINASTAAQDPAAVGYIGEFNSSASAISIPITNQAGLVQISPSNTALELTKDPGPSGDGAPRKYYPSGRRTYARVAPADHIQGGAQGEWMKRLGVKKLFIANDKQLYGVGVAKTTGDAARLNGIRVKANIGIDSRARNYRALAARIKASRADAFFFGGLTASNAVRLYRDVYAASPKIKLFGPDGVAETGFTSRLPKGAQRNMHITIGVIDPRDYPAEGQKFFQDFKAAHGDREPEPYAIYGYEAMSLLLDAMRRAGSACNDRAAIVDEVFRTTTRKSPLGTYSIDADGDVTTSRFGQFLVRNGKLSYDRTVKVRRDSYGHPLDD